MAETVSREDIEAALVAAMARLAALPTRRQWDVEPERRRLRAEVERLLTEYVGA